MADRPTSYTAPSGSGPEGKNTESRIFERRLAAFASTLGWNVVYRNQDVYLDEESRKSRGLDILLAISSPRSELNEGWLMDGKLHADSDAYVPSTRDEIEALREKTRKIRATAHRHGEEMKEQVDQMAGGMLVHGTTKYDPEKARRWLAGYSFQHGTERAIDALRVLFLGTDTLNGLGAAFARRGLGIPREFFWPPTGTYDAVWHRSCPPEQLAAGLIAYKNADDERILWLRGTMEEADVGALPELAAKWNLTFSAIVYTDLTEQEWRGGLSDLWTARTRSGARAARMPASVVALSQNHTNLTPFENQWQASE
jgi:hypothetical protein